MSDILLLGGLLAALAYLPLTSAQATARRSAIKTAPLVLFAMFAVVNGAPFLVTVGLVLSALGDLALSRSGQRAFLVGLCCFALAHVAYIGLFSSVAEPAIILSSAGPLFSALGLILLAGSTELWLVPFTGSLRWPVRGYVVVLAAMGLFALAAPDPHSLARPGAALFILSDLILAVQQFRLSPTSGWFRPAGRALWVCYVSGQFLILSAFSPLSLP